MLNKSTRAWNKKFSLQLFSSFFEVEQVTLNRHFLRFQYFENRVKELKMEFTGLAPSVSSLSAFCLD